MPTYCCVYRCSNNAKDQRGSHSFHRFPNKAKNPRLHRKWLRKIRRADFNPTVYTYVCSEHFVPEDYELTNKLKLDLLPGVKSKPSLKKSAVPSQKLRGAGDEEAGGVGHGGKVLRESSESEEDEEDEDVVPCESFVQCELGGETFRRVDLLVQYGYCGEDAAALRCRDDDEPAG